MQGFNNVSFSQVQYISAQDALEQFVFLDQFPRPVYTRGSVKLSETELQDYEISLLIAENSKLFYIRILDPIRVYVYEGKTYVINGNSRLYTISQAIQSGKDYEYAPIPYQYIECENPLTDEQLIRLQFSANDTTRKHRSIDKMRQLNDFISRAIQAGQKKSTARKAAVSYFGVTSQTLSNAEKLLECNNETLLKLLDEERITTDAASIVIDRANEFMMTIEFTLEAIARPISTDDFYYKASNVKKWAESFRKIVGTDQERLNAYVEENFRNQPTAENLNTHVLDAVAPEQDVMRGYECPTVEIDLEAVTTHIEDKLQVTYSKANADRLARILSAFPQRLSDNDCEEFFEDLLEFANKYHSRLSDSDRAELASALNVLK